MCIVYYYMHACDLKILGWNDLIHHPKCLQERQELTAPLHPCISFTPAKVIPVEEAELAALSGLLLSLFVPFRWVDLSGSSSQHQAALLG